MLHADLLLNLICRSGGLAAIRLLHRFFYIGNTFRLLFAAWPPLLQGMVL
jgi:hypothetical protein